MKDYPSSDFMRRVYNGFKFFVFTPFIFMLISLIFASAGSGSLTLLYVMPILMIAASGYIAFVAVTFNEDVSVNIRTYVTRLKIGAILWAVAAFIQLLYMITDGMGPTTGVLMMALSGLLMLGGYGTIGSGYGVLASKVGIRGAQLTSKGCYAVIAGVVLVFLLIFVQDAIDKPSYNGWLGPDRDEYQAYQTKIAWVSVFMVFSALSIFVSICAIIFGNRFMIDSVELFEIDEQTTNDINDNYNSIPIPELSNDEKPTTDSEPTKTI